MIKVLDIINQLASTSSRNDKERILKENQDNKIFKEVLSFVFNTYIVTGISKKKLNKKLDMLDTDSKSVNSIQELMEYLKENNTGRDLDIFKVQNFINTQPEELRELLQQIVTKDLKVGITSSTINKVYGADFLPSFDVMLAEKFFDNEDKVTGRFILTEKLDGIRSILIKENGVVKMFSRQGQPHEGFIEIEEEAKNLPDNVVLDGEFILVNKNRLNSADLYRETVKVARKDGLKKDIVFHVFDMMPLDNFKSGECKTPCEARKKSLEDVLSTEYTRIVNVPALYIGEDKNVILELLNKVTAEGKEGLMLNIADVPYLCKRTRNILKVKRMQTVDLEIVDFEEGDGRLKGTLGRMNVSYKNNICGVGSGFTDADRKYIWENKNDLIGKIAEIQYFEESSNSKTQEVSLRFPVFIQFRSDKDKPSYF